MDCHLRPQKNTKKSDYCPICLADKKLKAYEGKLFSIRKREKLFEEMSLIGSWKPTKEELIFKSIQATLKSKHAHPELIKDGETHINLLDNFKKEFKEIRRFWTFLDQQVCAQDELEMCKIRLQLKEAQEPTDREKISRIMKHLSYNTESKLENIHLISVHELDYQSCLLQTEIKTNTPKLDKLLGTQSYLETLRKQQFEGQSPDPCPICKNTLENHWSILLCGHSYCLECIQLLMEKTLGAHIQCSVCRNLQKREDISYIKAGYSEANDDDIKIQGSFSTKIEAILKLLLKLKSEDENIKILIFSTWVTVLESIGDALSKNGILFVKSWIGKIEDKVENFKNPSKKITVCLLPIHLGSKGLNLIEATHVILVEPILNPADELQAIGRVHRIGQTRPTIVHKFVIRNTIEESIFQATSTKAQCWDKNKITLGCLIDLFKTIDISCDENMGNLESASPNVGSETHNITNDIENIRSSAPNECAIVDDVNVCQSSQSNSKHLKIVDLVNNTNSLDTLESTSGGSTIFRDTNTANSSNPSLDLNDHSEIPHNVDDPSVTSNTNDIQDHTYGSEITNSVTSSLLCASSKSTDQIVNSCETLEVCSIGSDISDVESSIS